MSDATNTFRQARAQISFLSPFFLFFRFSPFLSLVGNGSCVCVRTRSFCGSGENRRVFSFVGKCVFSRETTGFRILGFDNLRTRSFFPFSTASITELILHNYSPTTREVLFSRFCLPSTHPPARPKIEKPFVPLPPLDLPRKPPAPPPPPKKKGLGA